MPNYDCSDRHNFGVNDVVMYQRWIRCIVVDIEIGGSLILQAYNPEEKIFSGDKFAASRFSCETKTVLDRSLLNSGPNERYHGPEDPEAREMINRIKDMAD